MIGLVIIIAVVGTFIAINNAKNNNKEGTAASNNGTDNKKVSDVEKAYSGTIVGTYKVKPISEEDRNIQIFTVTNQDENTIDFNIYVSNEEEIDNPIQGELYGKATKINVPSDAKKQKTTQAAYEYVEESNGASKRIIFVFTAHETFEYVTIYEDSGKKIVFNGDYERIQE